MSKVLISPPAKIFKAPSGRMRNLYLMSRSRCEVYPFINYSKEPDDRGAKISLRMFWCFFSENTCVQN